VEVTEASPDTADPTHLIQLSAVEGIGIEMNFTRVRYRCWRSLSGCVMTVAQLDPNRRRDE
jgi:hypothetical protein